MGNHEPLSQADVARRISEACAELRQVTTHLFQASREAAIARHHHKVAHDTAFLDATGSITDRRARATVACDRELAVLEMHQSHVDVLHEAGRNLRSELDGLRSLNANIRDAVTHAHGEEG